MELNFRTKGIALISLLEAGFSHKQCAVILDTTYNKALKLSHATKGHARNEPIPIDPASIARLEAKVGAREKTPGTWFKRSFWLTI